MGRMGWADAHARHAVNDPHTFQTLLLEPLISDLLQNTWLFERYTCQAQPTHNPYYHEYPETIVRFLREIAFGIEVNMRTVRIKPLTRMQYYYGVGEGDRGVEYSQQRVVVKNLFGSGVREFEIYSLVR